MFNKQKQNYLYKIRIPTKGKKLEKSTKHKFWS